MRTEVAPQEHRWSGGCAGYAVREGRILSHTMRTVNHAFIQMDSEALDAGGSKCSLRTPITHVICSWTKFASSVHHVRGLWYVQHDV